MNDPNLRYSLPKVSDVMSSSVIALTCDHSVLDALATFNKFGVSTIAVVDDKTNGLVGVVSEGDCLKQLSRSLFFDELTDESVGLITKTDVLKITSEMDIFQLEEFFQRLGIRHAPVVDEKNRVVGMVSRSDILKHLEKFTKEVLKYRHDVKEPLQLSKYKEFDMVAEEISDKHHFGALN